MLTFVVLMLTAVVRVGIILAVVYFLIPAKRSCPECGAETSTIYTPWLAIFLRTIVKRWCVECGWTGIRRRPLRGFRTPPRVENEPTPREPWQ